MRKASQSTLEEEISATYCFQDLFNQTRPGLKGAKVENDVINADRYEEELYWQNVLLLKK